MSKKILIAIFSAFVLLSCQNNAQKGSWFNFFLKNYVEIIEVKVYSNSILVPVTIGGKIRYFQLDTGAPTSISHDLFSELGLQVKDSAEAFDYYNNKKKIYDTILPELKINNTKFFNIKSGIIDPIQSFTPCGQRIDGYLGSDFFSESALQIDIRKKEIIIASSVESLNVEGHNSTDLKIMYGQKSPLITIYFPKVNAAEEVIFDTGSNNYFYRLRKSVFNQMLENKHIASKNILDTLDQSSNGSGLFGKQSDTVNFKVKFDSLTFVGVNILNCPAKTFNSPHHSILGAPFLRLGIVSIDFDNSKLYFNPYNKKPVDLNVPYGFTLTFKNDQMVVKSVQKDSEAQKNKIRAGYILTKLNSIKMDSLSLCDYFQIDWDLGII